MSTLAARLEAFRDRLLERLAAAQNAPSAVAAETNVLQSLLRHPLPDSVLPKPRQQPATVFLGAALESGMEGPEAALADAIQALVPDLTWTYGYPPDPGRPKLGEKIAFADILGKGGLSTAVDVLVGLTLIAPNTLYPLHVHPAIELYLVIAGAACWQAGDAAPRTNPPGTLILHPSGVPHATETTVEPLLALYIWRGDLASPSVFLPG